MDRIFIKVGLKRAPGADEYMKYTTHKKLGGLMDVLLVKEERGIWAERAQREPLPRLSQN